MKFQDLPRGHIFKCHRDILIKIKSIDNDCVNCIYFDGRVGLAFAQDVVEDLGPLSSYQKPPLTFKDLKVGHKFHFGTIKLDNNGGMVWIKLDDRYSPPYINCVTTKFEGGVSQLDTNVVDLGPATIS